MRKRKMYEQFLEKVSILESLDEWERYYLLSGSLTTSFSRIMHLVQYSVNFSFYMTTIAQKFCDVTSSCSVVLNTTGDLLTVVKVEMTSDFRAT